MPVPSRWLLCSQTVETHSATGTVRCPVAIHQTMIPSDTQRCTSPRASSSDPGRQPRRAHGAVHGSPSPTPGTAGRPQRKTESESPGGGRAPLLESWVYYFYRPAPADLTQRQAPHLHLSILLLPAVHTARGASRDAAAAAAAAPARQDGLGGDVEHGGVVAAAGGLLRAVAEPRRRGQQDGRLLLPLLPGRVPAAVAGASVQGLLLLPLLRQRQERRRRCRRTGRRRGRPRRPRPATQQPVDEGGGHRGGRSPRHGRRRRRRLRRPRQRDPEAGAVRARLRGGLLRALLLLRAHPVGRQPQPAARRHPPRRHVPPLRGAGRDRRVARPHRDGLAQRHRRPRLPQHRHLLRRPRLRRPRHALLHTAPARVRQYKVLLPVSEEPAEPEGGGGRRQGAPVRRRVGAEQHGDDASAAQEARAAGGGAAAARAAAADGAAAVARLRAGEAGEAQVLQRGTLQRHHGPDQARQARLPQQGLHLHPLANTPAAVAVAIAVVIAVVVNFAVVLEFSDLHRVTLPACVRALYLDWMGALLVGCVCTEEFLVLESFVEME